MFTGRTDGFYGNNAKILSFEIGDLMDRVSDITFVGHVCYDEIVPYGGQTYVAPGSAVLCGALAAARVSDRIAVITKMSPEDKHILVPLQENGVDVTVIPSAETTYMRVEQPGPSVDERIMYQEKNAGYITIDELGDFKSKYLHLAGITDQEFTLDLLRSLKDRSYCLSSDLQSFIRQVNLQTCEIHFNDVENKNEICSLLTRVKLDVVEGKLLTGHDDIGKAATEISTWGPEEVIVTQSEGILVKTQQKAYYEKFSNTNIVGRTGRGDTTYAAYLVWRMNHDIAASIKFAAALVSLKMEKKGPFSGTLDDVLKRMYDKHN